LRDPVTFKEMTKKACRDPADTFYWRTFPGVSSWHLKKSEL
jgi:hypothetical protein